jgi:uncharacterized protein with GYD domain
MPQYIMLFHFTEHGFSNLNDSPQRITDAKKVVTDAGGKVLQVYAVLGRYDTVWIIDAPNDETIAQISLHFSSRGSTRAETLRAFTESEYLSILGKMRL